MIKEDALKITASLNQQPTILTVLEKIVAEKATGEYKLFPNKHWLEKCLQIYTLSNTFKSMCVLIIVKISARALTSLVMAYIHI